MKLRYYMRGLGVGIIVTAILMTVTLNGKTEQLTDAEIIARAKALGMEEKYETTVLSETVSDDLHEAEAEEEPESDSRPEEDVEVSEEAELSEEAETSGEVETSEEAEASGETEVSEETEVSAQSGENTSAGQGAEQQEEGSSQASEIQEIVTDTESKSVVKITVQGGDGSMTVARKLKEAGVVSDILAYDKFLCRNGYDKKICTGTHEIPVGASDEEIAKIITTRVR